MNEDRLRQLLEDVVSGLLSWEKAFRRIKDLPYEDLGYAKIDYHRTLRKGFPETIFCEGKTPEQTAAIARHMWERGENVLGTRCSPESFAAVQKEVPQAHYDATARLFTICSEELPLSSSYVAVLCAGTSDLPVAEEAALTCESLGCRIERIYDVGVAGLHRLLEHREKLAEASAIIVCAGMEGALPSVVAGLVSSVVIAVPTSVGYGASFGGIAALLGMLNSCAPGLTVVNIDNGYGAAVAAAMINRLAERTRSE
ncbi:MAG: nickel pincer cofactor biosynthesis protein LarB [Candidatus Hydrogenedens sp.]|nr:nickel pincer cofactor biosynthesis protein LarB [Candidatus Hydrogenedens sp.]